MLRIPARSRRCFKFRLVSVFASGSGRQRGAVRHLVVVCALPRAFVLNSACNKSGRCLVQQDDAWLYKVQLASGRMWEVNCVVEKNESEQVQVGQ